MVVVDDSGIVYVNKGVFPFVDPTTGVRFEPGEEVKVLPTPWIKSQSVLYTEKVTPEPVKVVKAK